MKRFLSAIVLGAFMCLSLPVSAQVRNNAVDEHAIKNVNYFPGPAAAVRGSASYSGDTTNGTDWTRPFADGTCCSGLGPVKYETKAFRVDTTGSYNVSSVQDGWDGYLFVYEDTFDPNNQTVNFVNGDDDGNGGIGTSDIEGINLTAGVRYIVVQTGFENGEVGTYTNTISGAGNVSFNFNTVPTLGEWGMVAFIMSLAVAGAVMMRRRRLAA